MRFTTSQTDVYADHLDWHYRQNRTEKDVSRKVTHRRWYYSLTVSNSCASELLAFKFYHSKSKLSNWWVLVNFLNKIWPQEYKIFLIKKNFFEEYVFACIRVEHRFVPALKFQVSMTDFFFFFFGTL